MYSEQLNAFIIWSSRCKNYATDKRNIFVCILAISNRNSIFCCTVTFTKLISQLFLEWTRKNELIFSIYNILLIC